MPVGAAAGIAAAFNAPIAAVTFTIEEVVGDLDQAVLAWIVVSAAIAAAIERSILGEHPVFIITQHYRLGHASSLLSYAALGVGAAISQALREVENDDFSTYPVVNAQGGFVGIVTETRLRRTVAEGGMDQAVGAIAQPAAQVGPAHILIRAVVRMEKSGVRQLAVIDEKGGNRLIGLLTMSDIVRAHAQAALEAGDPDKSAAPESSPLSSNP